MPQLVRAMNQHRARGFEVPNGERTAVVSNGKPFSIRRKLGASGPRLLGRDATFRLFQPDQFSAVSNGDDPDITVRQAERGLLHVSIEGRLKHGLSVAKRVFNTEI